MLWVASHDDVFLRNVTERELWLQSGKLVSP
jgi:ATPase subunit of ABC transporter with duplicated ATPase domains